MATILRAPPGDVLAPTKRRVHEGEEEQSWPVLSGAGMTIPPDLIAP